jgi:hypothetical protein
MSLHSVLAFAIALAACASPTDLPDTPPTIDGPVITVAGTSVHIRPASDSCGIVFSIDNDTRILESVNDEIVEADRSDITVGRRAKVWTFGPIAESCPAQAEADVVLLY